MSRTDGYSAWKLAWLPGHLARIRRGRLCPPCHVQLHLTGACNLRCTWCVYDGGVPRLQRDKSKQLDTRLAIQFLDDFWELGGRAVEITGGGEPTLHPDFIPILDHALNKGLDVAVITNGLTPQPAALLARVPKLAWMRISLDATTDEEFLRRKGGWDVNSQTPFERVKAFVTLAARTKRDNLVSVSYLLGEDTKEGEVTRAVELARDLGVDQIRFAPRYRGDGLENYPRVGEKELEEAEEKNPGFVVDLSWQRWADEDYKNDHPDKPCGYMFTSFVVGCDSRIYPCCWRVYEKDAYSWDLTPRPAVGLPKGGRFRDWWYNPHREADIKRFERSRCRGIPCWQREKNEAFDTLVEGPPQHLYFI